MLKYIALKDFKTNKDVAISRKQKFEDEQNETYCDCPQKTLDNQFLQLFSRTLVGKILKLKSEN